jgi:tetratricopeptide (TPR) repeat protein
MGVLVWVERACFRIAKHHEGKALGAVRRAATLAFPDEPAVASSRSLAEALEGAGFCVMTDVDGTVVVFDYVHDKLPKRADWADVAHFFSRLARFVTRHGHIDFGEEGGAFHQFSFDFGKVHWQSDAAYLLAQSHFAAGRRVRALEVLDVALKRRRPDCDGVLLRVSMLREMNRLEEAAKAARAALRLDSASVGGWRMYGALCADLGRKADAVSAFQRVAALEAKDPRALHECADRLLGLQKPKEALALAVRALELTRADDRDRAKLLDLRGQCLRALARRARTAG